MDKRKRMIGPVCYVGGAENEDIAVSQSLQNTQAAGTPMELVCCKYSRAHVQAQDDERRLRSLRKAPPKHKPDGSALSPDKIRLV